MNPTEALKKIALPLTLGLGLAALVLIENGPGGQVMEHGRLIVHQKNTWRNLIDVSGKREKREVQSPLKQMMAADELAGQNPYTDVSEDAALTSALKDVKAFERTTLRSASYRDEAGYDLVHYEILHQDGSISQILAHVDYDESLDQEKPDAPKVKLESVVVLVLNPVADEQYQLTQFKNGLPMEGLNLPRSRGEARVAQKLEQAIPFLSVSR